jgi:tRNA pseudouridine38-40 synthase
MPTFRLTLAYDGTDFAGWQRQPKVRTIQEELEAALGRVTTWRPICFASGRTDAGVHALGQVVSFDSATRLPPAELTKALNAELPEDMHVFDVQRAPDGFHAQKYAVRKRYRYLIEDGRPRDLFARNYLWHIRQRLDIEAMQTAGNALLGKHDFISYEGGGSSRITTERTIFDLFVERRQSELTHRIAIEVEAYGFLYNMVRIIVGTLVQVGKGKESIDWPAKLLELRDRAKSGMTAPAQGLYLVGVQYDEELERGAENAKCGMNVGEDDFVQ